MGRKPVRLTGPKSSLWVKRLKTAFDSWWPESSLFWIGVFAGLYILTYFISVWPAQVWEVIPDRISLFYLPSFIRVVAVLIAGLAGLVGVFLGSLLVAVFFVGDALSHAVWIALASCLGAFAACWLMRQALATDKLPFTLPVLMVMSVLYSAFNAIFHALMWGFIGGYEIITINHVALMIVGDFFGVIVGFMLMRIAMRFLKISGLFRRTGG